MTEGLGWLRLRACLLLLLLLGPAPLQTAAAVAAAATGRCWHHQQAMGPLESATGVQYLALMVPV